MTADSDADPQFEEVRERATDAIDGESVESVYVGLAHDDGEQEYYFGNRTEGADELREAAANQLGMLVAVLAAQSDESVEEVLDLARERAERMALR